MTERAYLVELPRCICGRPATVEIKNGVNATLGRYCNACGKRELRRFKEGK